MPKLRERIKAWASRWKSDPYDGKSTVERFQAIYASNDWKDEESVSGPGSNSVQTEEAKSILEKVIREYEVQTLVDIPCGDFGWLQKIEIGDCKYIGGDIVPALVERNDNVYGNDQRKFEVIDLITDPLPDGDLLLVRDCLVHLSESQIKQAVTNIKASSIPYLITTHFTGDHINYDIHTGDWRPINLEKAPFLFPKPLAVYNEKNTENNGAYADKSLAIWRVDQLPHYE